MGKNKGGGNGGNVGGQNGGKPVEEEAKNRGGENKQMKKEEGSITVVLKVYMHCEGCCKKVKNSLKGIQGIEKVTADIGSSKLTVIGKVDPIRIRDRVQHKTRKNVELMSPAPKKNNDNSNKDNEKKEKEPQVVTAVFKIWLHCEGCIERIRKKIKKIKGVVSVSLELEKDLVTVKGIMDVKSLAEILREKLKRSVEIVPPKKENNGEKKESNEGGEKNRGNKKEGEAAGPGEAKKMVYYYGEYGNSPYYIDMLRAPQMFSDENPNSCSIM